VRAQIAELLASTRLRDAPVFPLDARRPDESRVAALRAYLFAAIARSSQRAADGFFRLAIDRVFTLAGHGTIAAGMVTNGAIRVGDTVTIMPAGVTARVRSIHAQNRPADAGFAGQRCALNLAQVEKFAIARGDWLADAHALAATTRIEARLRLFVDAPQLTQWSLLHIHFGAAHHTARAVLLDTERLAAGASGRAQFVFDVPVCAAPGDRFIIRDAQAAHTIGGGVLLDPFAPARKRRSPERLRRLDALERLIAGEGIGPLLAGAPHGIAETELVQLTGRALEALPGGTRLVVTSAGRVAIDERHWQDLRTRALTALGDFHVHAPDETGPDVGRLRRIAAPQLAAPIWLALVDELVRDQVAARKGPWLHLPQHTVMLSAEERALADQVLPLLAQGGFDPPWTRDLARAAHVSEEAMRRTLRKLAAEGAALQIVPDLFYAPEIVAELARVAADVAAADGQLEVTHYRDRIGIGRKRAIQILEFFDRVGYTRRQRDARVLRSDSGWKNTLQD